MRQICQWRQNSPWGSRPTGSPTYHLRTLDGLIGPEAAFTAQRSRISFDGQVTSIRHPRPYNEPVGTEVLGGARPKSAVLSIVVGTARARVHGVYGVVALVMPPTVAQTQKSNPSRSCK